MRDSATWRVFAMYMIILVLALFCGSVFGQVTVVHYNADWNDANKVEWMEDLKDCELEYVDIAKKPKQQSKHEIIVVPTIIIFKDGEEVKRFQADISFTMQAKLEDVQDVINEQLMSDF